MFRDSKRNSSNRKNYNEKSDIENEENCRRIMKNKVMQIVETSMNKVHQASEEEKKLSKVEYSIFICF